MNKVPLKLEFRSGGSAHITLPTNITITILIIQNAHMTASIWGHQSAPTTIQWGPQRNIKRTLSGCWIWTTVTFISLTKCWPALMLGSCFLDVKTRHHPLLPLLLFVLSCCSWPFTRLRVDTWIRTYFYSREKENRGLDAFSATDSSTLKASVVHLQTFVLNKYFAAIGTKEHFQLQQSCYWELPLKQLFFLDGHLRGHRKL